MKILKYLILSLCMPMVGCTPSVIPENTITVDLNQEMVEPAFDELLGSIEVIPLETTESSLIVRADAYQLWNDTLFVLDKLQNEVFMFDMMGRFLKRLDKHGEGPDEFISPMDMKVNRFTGNLEILSVEGNIMIYKNDFSEFIGRIKLPTHHVHSYHHVSPDVYALYFDNRKVHSLNFYSVSENRIVGSAWSPLPAFCMTGFLAMDPFFVHGDELYLYQGYDGNIFRLNEEEPYMDLLYGWDFGEHTFDPEDVPEGKDVKYYHDLYMKGSEGKVLGFVPCGMSNRYIISRFRYDNRYVYLFYNRETQDVTAFNSFKEDFFPAIEKMTDEYLYCIVPFDYLGKVVADELLDEDCLDKLKLLNEDSNPCLTIYRFKPNVSSLAVCGEVK